MITPFHIPMPVHVCLDSVAHNVNVTFDRVKWIFVGMMVQCTQKSKTIIIYLLVGTCAEIANRTFLCQCTLGWYDDRCQTMIDYCQKGACLHNGVCQPLLWNYTCRCLDGSYSGRDCEIVANRLFIRQMVSKSPAYVAASAMVAVATFVIILDVLKYCFGIDLAGPTRKELQFIKAK